MRASPVTVPPCGYPGPLGRVDVRPLEFLDGPLALEVLEYPFRVLTHTSASLRVVARSGTVRVIAGPQTSNSRNFQKASPIIRDITCVCPMPRSCPPPRAL
jgi:hypothetical protein